MDYCSADKNDIIWDSYIDSGVISYNNEYLSGFIFDGGWVMDGIHLLMMIGYLIRMDIQVINIMIIG